ncbi:hypothetical protein MMC15_008541 [Xylographa vitiligo]|nr:hypothetical protein [Xylographa vitiligo]
MAATKTAHIPVIDLSSFTTKGADSAAGRQTAKEAAEKFSNNGCLAITGDGVPPELLVEAFDLTRRLFDLPQEDKMKAPHPAGMVPRRGYSAPGKERAFQNGDHDHSDAQRQEMLRMTQNWKGSSGAVKNKIKTPPRDNADAFLLTYGRKVTKSLPDSTLPGFCARSTEIFNKLRALSFAVLEAFIMGMKPTEKESEMVTRVHEGPVCQLRLLHYLPLDVDHRVVEEAKRLPAHTDWSSFTLSFQDATGGREFQDRHSGSFMLVIPRSDAVYLNVGDMMERISNGLYPGCTHRVVLPKVRASVDATVNENGTVKAPARYSVIFFLTVSDEAIVKPPSSPMKRDGGAKYDSTTYKAYAEQRMKWQYEDYEQKGKEND